MDVPLRLPAHAPSGGCFDTNTCSRNHSYITYRSIQPFVHRTSFLQPCICGCLLQTILGGWDRANPVGRNLTSKLAQEVADKELCHSYMTFNTCYKVG